MSISKKRPKETLAVGEEDIDYSDIPELGDEFWESAKLVIPVPKQSISLRVDPDIIAWFKSQGKGYQSRMNAVLRSYMLAKR